MYAPAEFLRPYRPPSQERALFWCVLASLALHALAFWGLPLRHSAAPPAKSMLVLTARLAPITAAPRERQATTAPRPAPEARSEKPLEQPAEKPVREARPLRTKPAEKVTPKDLPKPAPVMSSAVRAEAPKAATQDTAPAAPVAPPPSAAPSSTSSPAQTAAVAPSTSAMPSDARSGSEADTGTLEQYRLSLIVATRRYKRYPAIAMEKGWQGKVEVRMVIGANGMLAATSIKTSSGHDILDKQALDMLKKGKTTVPIPASLRGREFSVVVPVIFSLDNPGA